MLSTSPSLNWTPALDDGSGISSYQISIGTASGLTDIRDWTRVGLTNLITISGLTLTLGTTYFVNLRSIDMEGNISSVVFSGWRETSFRLFCYKFSL